LASGSAAQGQTIGFSVQEIALRNGETVEFGDVYYVGTDCRSLLTDAPEVEILDGPPGVAVTIRRAMVVPRADGCGRSVLGGKMLISASDIEDYSYTRMVVRFTYRTLSGNVRRSQHINVTLFP